MKNGNRQEAKKNEHIYIDCLRGCVRLLRTLSERGREGEREKSRSERKKKNKSNLGWRITEIRNKQQLNEKEKMSLNCKKNLANNWKLFHLNEEWVLYASEEERQRTRTR